MTLLRLPLKRSVLNLHSYLFPAVRKRDAGLAAVDVTVTTPLSKELPLEVKSLPNGEGDMVEFFPTVPGKYRFNVLYGGDEIPGSPFIFVVDEEGLAKAHGEGLLHALEGTAAQFYIDARELIGEPTVQVRTSCMWLLRWFINGFLFLV